MARLQYLSLDLAAHRMSESRATLDQWLVIECGVPPDNHSIMSSWAKGIDRLMDLWRRIQRPGYLPSLIPYTCAILRRFGAAGFYDNHVGLTLKLLESAALQERAGMKARKVARKILGQCLRASLPPLTGRTTKPAPELLLDRYERTLTTLKTLPRHKSAIKMMFHEQLPGLSKALQQEIVRHHPHWEHSGHRLTLKALAEQYSVGRHPVQPETVEQWLVGARRIQSVKEALLYLEEN